uniref:Proteasome subunit beta n=1 Tax=Dicentrarchus labrax TaxID=13489 RepID=A0A8P4G2U1_DICLA
MRSGTTLREKMAAAAMVPIFGQNVSDKYDLVPDWTSREVSTGTTIMAVEYDGGVVIGADSRTTTGAYIANRVTDKLTPIHDRIFCCRSGSAADTQAIADVVTYQLGFHSIELDEPPLVETAANLFKASCYRYREELTAGILVAGWDRRKGGQVYCVPIGGMLVRQPVSVGGSGSSYIYGFMDSNYKPGLSKDQCLELTAAGTHCCCKACWELPSTVIHTLYHLSHSLYLSVSQLCLWRWRGDGSSGGVVRLASISEEGVERRVLLGNQLPKFSTH